MSRLMRMTRAVGVSQAKTRGLRGVNPFLSRFLGLSCFGGLTDFQKTLKKKFKNRHILQQMCLFCYIVLPNALLPATMASLWEIMLSIRVLTVILPVVKVLR